MRNTRIYWLFTKGWEPTPFPYWFCNLLWGVIVLLAARALYLAASGG